MTTSTARCWPTISISSASPRSRPSATKFDLGTDGRTLDLPVARPAARDRRTHRSSGRRRRAEAAERTGPQERLDRARPRQRRDRSARRVVADVSRGVAPAGRALLGRRHERHRLGSRLRSICGPASARTHARRALRSHLGDAGRARHVARLRMGRRLSRASAVPARLPRRRPALGRASAAATASSESIAETRGTASTTRRSQSRVSTCAKAIASSRSAASACRARLRRIGSSSTRAAASVSVTLRGKKGEERTVLVKALANEAALRYRAWVEENRRIVHERTGERVGYLHIPDMGPWGFSEFHRGYLGEFDRKGLIVDVRYNRGGHVSPLLAREARSQAHGIRRAALRRAAAVSAGVGGRSDRGADQSVRGLRRRHLQSLLQALQAGAARRQTDVGRRHRHRSVPSSRRRNAHDAAGVLVLVRRRRLAASRTTEPIRITTSTSLRTIIATEETRNSISRSR